MKLVKESLYEFDRNTTLKKATGIGVLSKIKRNMEKDQSYTYFLGAKDDPFGPYAMMVYSVSVGNINDVKFLLNNYDYGHNILNMSIIIDVAIHYEEYDILNILLNDGFTLSNTSDISAVLDSVKGIDNKIKVARILADHNIMPAWIKGYFIDNNILDSEEIDDQIGIPFYEYND